MTNKLFLLVAFQFFFACSQPKTSESPCNKEFYRKVQVSNVISNPEEYNQEFIEVNGYLAWRFEEGALYPKYRDAKKMNKSSAIWIGKSKLIENNYSKLQDFFKDKNIRHVTLVGRFRNHQGGHLNQYSFSLEEVECLQLGDQVVSNGSD